MRTAISLVFLSLWICSSPGADAKRVFKPEDFAALRDVDEPNLSPDGQRVVYVVGTVDLTKDTYRSNAIRTTQMSFQSTMFMAFCQKIPNRMTGSIKVP